MIIENENAKESVGYADLEKGTLELQAGSMKAYAGNMILRIENIKSAIKMLDGSNTALPILAERMMKGYGPMVISLGENVKGINVGDRVMLRPQNSFVRFLEDNDYLYLMGNASEVMSIITSNESNPE